MNKLTKVGCSALCGSLAAISAAHAGDITVTGGADMTWISMGGIAGDPTGNPFGVGSNATFKGSGELDNGWTFDLSIANTNLMAYSSANVDLTMGGFGSINLDQGDSGNGLAAFDDKMPTAWEESWGAGLSTGVRLLTGAGSSQNLQYTSPKMAATTVVLAWAPDAGVKDTADKTTGASDDGTYGQKDVTINVNPSTEIMSGLNMFVGASVKERATNNATTQDDAYYGTFGVTIDIGPVSLGTQWMGEYTGEERIAKFHSYKTHAFGVAFNINDDLSVSYNEFEQRKVGYTTSAALTGLPEDRVIKVESTQISYTMGGASIRYADVNAKNVAFSAANDKEAHIVSLGLAF
jgi:outer membrane protein OmpU